MTAYQIKPLSENGRVTVVDVTLGPIANCIIAEYLAARRKIFQVREVNETHYAKHDKLIREYAEKIGVNAIDFPSYVTVFCTEEARRLSNLSPCNVESSNRDGKVHGGEGGL